MTTTERPTDHPIDRPVDDTAVDDLLGLVTGAWKAQAVHTAAALNLPDHVAAGRTTDAELVEVTGATGDGVPRLMRLLVGLGVFTRDDDGRYRTTGVGEALRADRPGSLREMCLLYGQEFYSAWARAGEAITTGTSGFERAHGRSLISYLGADDDAAARFQRAMRAGNFVFDHVADAYDFSGCDSVVDVGGGNGELLEAVLRATPRARGVLADLGHMVPIAREHLARTVGADRAEVVEQDIFDAVPPGGDVYLLSRVLGDWEDDDALRLLTTLRRAMTPQARLLILERVVPEDGSSLLASLWDVHLLVMNGGRHRSLRQVRALLSRAGLALERVGELPMETSMLVIRRS